MFACASLGLESVCNEYEFISQFWTTCNYYLSLICETSNSSDFIYYTYCLTAIMFDSYQDINQPVLYTVLLRNATTDQFNSWDLSGFNPSWRTLQPPPPHPVPKLISKCDKSEIILLSDHVWRRDALTGFDMHSPPTSFSFTAPPTTYPPFHMFVTWPCKTVYIPVPLQINVTSVKT